MRNQPLVYRGKEKSMYKNTFPGLYDQCYNDQTFILILLMKY